MLGSWDFKSKRQQGVFCPEGLCRAYMFALAVTEQLDTWPEQHSRQRQWVSQIMFFLLFMRKLLVLISHASFLHTVETTHICIGWEFTEISLTSGI